MEAAYFLDSNDKEILSYPGKPEDLFASIKASLSEFDDNIDSKEQVFELQSGLLVHRQTFAKISLFIVFSAELPPLIVQQFSKKVVAVLSVYFDAVVTPALLQENAETVLLLMSQMLSCNQPQTTELDILQHVIPVPSLIGRLLPGPTAMNVPKAWELSWRRPKIESAPNEIFIDVIEKVTAIFDPMTRKRGQLKDAVDLSHSSNFQLKPYPSRTKISGYINLTTLIAGTPQIEINLETPGRLSGIQFHPCVDIAEWTKNGTITMIPPNGPCSIAKYTIRDVKNFGLVNAVLFRQEGDLANEFEIQVAIGFSAKVKHISNLKITVLFPESTTTIHELRTTAGNFDTSNPKKAVWTFLPETPLRWSASLRASAMIEEKPCQPLMVLVDYTLTGQSTSGISIKSVHISPASAPPPFKGVRYLTKIDEFCVR